MRVFGWITLSCLLAGCQVTIGDGQNGTGGASGNGSGSSSPSGGNDADRRAGIDSLVTQSGKLEVAPAQPAQEISCDGQCPTSAQEGKLSCSYKRFDETRIFSDLVAFEPTSAALWPGSVVVGQDARNGLLTPVGVNLAPVTFSVSLENLSGSPTGKMDKPSLSAFRERMQDILKGATNAKAPARISYTEERVDSEEQLALALGFGAGYLTFEAKGSFHFSSGSRRTKLVANFAQAYYTVDVDAPKTPADFFTSDVTAAQLGAYASPGNPPLYVQSITYGRRAIFMLETDSTFEEIKSSLQASYDAFVFHAEGSLSTEDKQRLENSSMKVIFLGGSGVSAAQAIQGYDGFKQAILEGAEYSPDSPGAPIGYKLAYLDNATASFHLTSEYTVRDCVPTIGSLSASLTKINAITSDGAGLSEYYGDIGVFYPTTGNGGCEDSSSKYLSLMSLVEGQSWQPGGDYSNSVSSVPLGPGKKACIYVELYEDDALFDDVFAVKYKEVPLQDGFFKIPVSGSDEQAEVWVQLGVQ